MKKYIIMAFLFFCNIGILNAYTETKIADISSPGINITYMPLMYNKDINNTRIINVYKSGSNAIINLKNGSSGEIISTNSFDIGVSATRINKIINVGDYSYYEDKYHIYIMRINYGSEIISYPLIINNSNDGIYVNSSNFTWMGNKTYIAGLVDNYIIYNITDYTSYYGGLIAYNINNNTWINIPGSIDLNLYKLNGCDIRNDIKIGKIINSQIVSNTSQVLYANPNTTSQKYYNMMSYDGTSCYNVQIFTGNPIGGQLGSPNLPEKFGIADKYKFTYLPIDSATGRMYLSLCKETGFTGTTSQGYYDTYNITLVAYYEGIVTDGFYIADSKYYDYRVYTQWWKFLNSGEILTRQNICDESHAYTNISSNIPGAILYIKRTGTISFGLYKAILTNEEKSNISGGGISGTGNTFIPETEIPDDKINETGSGSIWDIDRDKNGEISFTEALLSPLTIIQNIIKEIYNGILNIWGLIKTLMDIGNIFILNTTYASNEQFLTKIVGNTTTIINSDVNSSPLPGFTLTFNRFWTLVLFAFFMAGVMLFLTFKGGKGSDGE